MESQFRVIVIGAGVAGLAASHCLQRAGIDHVVLERRNEMAPPEGASITVFPHVLRVFNQLGFMKALFDASTLHDRAWTRWADGSVAANSGLYDYIREK
jgi:2-polyprenyl-6-methoxyphenol hydroxylase-like FAD-dependent oxidoreductase